MYVYVCMYNTDFWSQTNSNTFICNSELHASHEAIIMTNDNNNGYIHRYTNMKTDNNAH